MSLYGAVGFGAEAPNCADALKIIGRSDDAARLRRLLRRSSLAEPVSGSCGVYQVRLIRNGSEGWTLSVSDSNTPVSKERRVSRIAHAATWLEAWSQSGFGPLDDEADLPSPQQPVEGRGPSASAGREPSAPPAPVLPLRLSAGPVLGVTDQRHWFSGGVLGMAVGARQAPQLGFNVGAATELAASDVTYRRHVWAGPELGFPIRLGDELDCIPRASMGLAGTTAMAQLSATAMGLYFGLDGALRWTFTRAFDVSLGLDTRVLLPRAFASSSESAESEDDEETTTAVAVAPTPSKVALWVGLRLTLAWNVGGVT